MVKLNDKYNFINTNGEIVSKQWFDWTSDFSNGFAIVRLNDKKNLINTDGEIVSNQWFDDAWYFENNFAPVFLNGKEYYLRRDGVLCDYNTKKPLHESKINNINNINNINMKQSIRLTESELHNIIKESVINVLNENATPNVWDVLEELKEYMSCDDIIARIISRIGDHEALKIFNDIKNVEIDSMNEYE
jgi:hypothetical protein